MTTLYPLWSLVSIFWTAVLPLLLLAGVVRLLASVTSVVCAYSS